MKLKPTSLKFQVIALSAIAAVVAIYCYLDNGCSLLTADQQGYRLYVRGDYQQAGQHFVDPMWQGVALFKQGEFKAAAGIFAGFDNAQAAFNHGNALMMSGKYTDAVTRYERVLELRPDWEDAMINRKIALARAQQVKKEGGEMTGGKLEADEIVFDKGKSPKADGEEQVEGGAKLEDAGLREVWLRQVQTKPADFLRSKFAYQQAMRATSTAGQAEGK